MTLEELEQRKMKLLEELKTVKDPDRELELTAQIEVIDTLIRNKKRTMDAAAASMKATRKSDDSLLDLGDVDFDPNEQLIVVRNDDIEDTSDPDELYERGKKAYADGDQAWAFEYYLKAAKLGHAGAQCNVGYMYEFGEGVAQSLSSAAEWYWKSADQGFDNAQCNLG